MRSRSHVHLLRATGVLGGVAVAVFLLALGGNAEILPPLQVLLTKPPSEWAEPEVETQVDVLEETVQVAVKPPPARDMRVASMGAPTSDAQVTQTTPSASTEASSPVEAAAPEAPPTADAPEPPGDPREETLELMRHGRELVRAGMRLPRLDARFRLEDIETLCRRGHGIVTAEWDDDDDDLRVVPAEGALAAAGDFRVVTPETRSGLSNRCFNLTHYRALRPLLERVRRHLGLGQGESCRLLFRLSSELDRGFATKQLGALARLGIDVEAHDDIATQGELRVTRAGTRYLIRTVRVGARTHTFHDPEARLPGAKDS